MSGLMAMVCKRDLCDNSHGKNAAGRMCKITTFHSLKSEGAPQSKTEYKHAETHEMTKDRSYAR